MAFNLIKIPVKFIGSSRARVLDEITHLLIRAGCRRGPRAVRAADMTHEAYSSGDINGWTYGHGHLHGALALTLS